MKTLVLFMLIVLVYSSVVLSQQKIKTVNGWNLSGGYSLWIDYSKTKSTFDSSGQTFSSFGYPLPVGALRLWNFSITWEKTFPNLGVPKSVSAGFKFEQGVNLDSVQSSIDFGDSKIYLKFQFWAGSFHYLGGNVQVKNLKVVDSSGIEHIIDFGNVTGIPKPVQNPKELTLYQNYPNPFNPSTTINYSVPQSGETSLKVYNLLGEEVVTLYSGFLQAGNHVATFNGGNLASGIYFYRLQTGNLVETKRLVLLK